MILQAPWPPQIDQKSDKYGHERTNRNHNLDATTTTVTLKPGVAFCFRAFYGLLRDLIQGAWVRFVQKLNANDLGNLTDLGTFLFDQERSSLEMYKHVLLDFQERKCFYCHDVLRGGTDVDHFISWSRYPTDLGHKFVLAHPRCNNAKSDYLAAEQHLHKWAKLNRLRSAELAERLRDANLPHENAASIRITEWAYEQVEKAHGQVWISDAEFQHLGVRWRELLVA
jgi:5-methylcytosine-specific restriction endonuclease McrA